MNKVICDVCGTDYPETAAQCPICGCATAGGQTSAGNAAPGEEENAAYTYVKGGRFSKSNVRKRLKQNQVQESRIVEPEPEDIYDEEDDDEDDELEQEEGSSNRGLLIIVALLLLAIIAVSVYIAISIFGVGSGDETSGRRNPVVQTTDPTSNVEETPDRVACISLNLRDMEINLKSKDSAWDLIVTQEPKNTTDVLEFSSSDENVAVVDSNGRVTAVGNGEADILVQCGDVSVKCPVFCNFSSEPANTDEATEPSDVTDPTGETDATDVTDETDTTDETDATEPEDTTETTESTDGFTLKLKSGDFTLFAAGDTYVLYNGDVAASEITWTSDNESIAEIKNGVVTAIGPGSTKVNAEYNGQKAVCWVRCSFEVEDTTETTEPTETTGATDETESTETTESTDATESTEPATQTYVLRKNGAKCTYGDDYTAHATIEVGESFKLAVVDGNNKAQDVTWVASKSGICTVNGTTVTGSGVGHVTLTVTYEGKTYTCYLIVR